MMNLSAQRPWITPLVIGAFLVSAVTGVLMFLHLDTGLNKAAHEWLGWVMGAFALVLALSFIPAAGQGEPGFAPPVRALAQTPIAVLAQVAGTSTVEVKARLLAAGFTASSDEQSVADLVGGDLRRQIGVLSKVVASGPAR